MRASKRKKYYPAAFCALLLLRTFSAWAEAPENPFRFFEEEAQVITASRRVQPIRESPADVTVITAEELKNLGARTIADALALLSGVQITTHRKGSEKIWIRGVASAYNDKTLLLIDGYPFKELTYGQHPIDEQLPIADVKRIEVVKGPGSVSYGANALAGVINIITMEPGDVPETKVWAGFGNWRTQSYGILFGKNSEKAGLVFSGTFYGTDGGSHERDTESGKISHTNRDPNQLASMNLKLSLSDFTLALRHGEHKTDYSGYPDAKVLHWDNRTTLVQLGWKHAASERLLLVSKVYFNNFDWPRSKTSKNADLITLKALENTDEHTQVYGAGFQAECRVFDGNVLVAGAEYEGERALEIHDKEYDATAANPAPALIRWTDPLRPASHNAALFAEDSWKIAPWWHFVFGARYDRHSRYGSQLSPRGAVIVNPSGDLAFRFIHGRAFRAPSFRELYVVEAAAVDNGNPDLKPEQIRTSELKADYRFAGRFSAGFSLFYNVISDFIAPDPAIAKYGNLGRYRIRGVEPELRIKPGGRYWAFVNATLLEAEDENGRPMPEIAETMFNAGVFIELYRHLNLNSTLSHIGRRNHPANYQSGATASARKDLLGSYERVNLALTTKELPVELSLAVHNLFNVRSFNPNYGRDGYDVQHPRRSFQVKIGYKF